MSLYQVSIFGLIALLSSGTVFSDPCFGDGNCDFPCNCNGPCHPTHGHCYAGCQQLLPPGYGWEGPACQVGNLAINASTRQSSLFNGEHYRHGPQVAVDGDLTATNFTMTDYHNPKTDFWWEVELPHTSVIFNVTIYTADASERMGYFNIRIGNTSQPKDNELCRYFDGNLNRATVATFDCTHQMTGKYISVQFTQRTGDGYLMMVEVVVMGFKYMDCQPGFQTSPGCLEPCPDQTFGEYCGRTCHCYNPAEICEKTNGSCVQSGCPLWYAGEDCYVLIPVPERPENITLPTISSNSFNISWAAPANIPRNFHEHYNYEVQLKDEIEWITLLNTSQTWAMVERLTYNTIYQVRIVPYRIQRDVREVGMTSHELFVKLCAECAVPSNGAVIGLAVALALVFAWAIAATVAAIFIRSQLTELRGISKRIHRAQQFDNVQVEKTTKQSVPSIYVCPDFPDQNKGLDDDNTRGQNIYTNN